MKTTHQLARELLSLPDVEVVLEGSCHAGDYEIGAKLTSYNENKAIVMMIDRLPMEERKEHNRKMEEKFPTEMVWMVFEPSVDPFKPAFQVTPLKGLPYPSRR